MSATLYETYDSRQFAVGGTSPTATLKYIAITTLPTLEDEVRIAAAGTAPLIFQGMYRRDINCVPIGGRAWAVDVAYAIPDDGQNLSELPGQGNPESPAPAQTEPSTTVPIGPEYSFSTGGGTKKILQSLETQQAVAPVGQVAPDFKQAINATINGVEGVDIVAPSLEWTYTRTFGFITLEYIRLLSLYTGSVNDDTFFGHEAGELLFLGADGACKPQGDSGNSVWSITYRFASSRNREDVAVSSEITVPLVRGHEYLWCSYDASADPLATPAALIRKPRAAYVEQVYPYRPFRNLGI